MTLSSRDKGYLAGNWVSGDKNQTFDVINPARGDTIAKVANLSREQISAAIDMHTRHKKSGPIELERKGKYPETLV